MSSLFSIRYLILLLVPLFILLTAATPLTMLSVAAQQSQPTQPVYNDRAWPNSSIPIHMQSNFADSPSTSVPSYAKQAALNAMTIWNLAQEWFRQTYMSNAGNVYTLYEAAAISSYGITITFNQTGTLAGYTDCNVSLNASGNAVTRISCLINLNADRTPSNLRATATHEIGRALGLKHSTPIYDDLMYGSHTTYNYVPRPSTLNLYAVYLLAQAGGNLGNVPGNPITLPASIPYMAAPENAVPEFNFTLITLLFSLISTSYIVKRRRINCRADRKDDRLHLCNEGIQQTKIRQQTNYRHWDRSHSFCAVR